IGAYLPRWFMARQHIDPDEAVAVHILMGASQSIAIHHATFQLGDDSQDEAADNLLRALRKAGIPEAQFWLPTNGQSQFFESANESVARTPSY
ncbi:MAG: MBL fold metallo-hydrolase, partial [Gammaproteobacteria bacterium]|nr:MBL fold metallo-hydrolase [Gammaproteobacteria bacterium]